MTEFGSFNCIACNQENLYTRKWKKKKIELQRIWITLWIDRKTNPIYTWTCQLRNS